MYIYNVGIYSLFSKECSWQTNEECNFEIKKLEKSAILAITNCLILSIYPLGINYLHIVTNSMETEHLICLKKLGLRFVWDGDSTKNPHMLLIRYVITYPQIGNSKDKD